MIEVDILPRGFCDFILPAYNTSFNPTFISFPIFFQFYGRITTISHKYKLHVVEERQYFSYLIVSAKT